MISAERLERYKDFVDPERTGEPYDPRKGLERLMGVLSPDSKGIVLTAMGYDWYGSSSQLRAAIFSWFEELGLPSGIWPVTITTTWQYCEQRNKQGEIIDGSLVNLGAVVKKAEDPLQVLYSRSAVGAELAVPLVQQAVRFVSKAREYAEAQELQGRKPHKFDSMWRIIGSVQSVTDQRRPLAVWDVIDFLKHNPGKHRQLDLHSQTHIPISRLGQILESLSNCGIIDYTSPLKDVEGYKVKGWSVSTLANRQKAADLDPNRIYSDIRGIRTHLHGRGSLTKVIDYIKEYPGSEYEYVSLAKKLDIPTSTVSWILSLLVDLSVLQRPDPGFKGADTVSSASANDLTFIFYDLVCAPAKDLADTLSPLPQRSWNIKEIAIYLENYNQERSNGGPQAGEDTRSLLLDILTKHGSEMKQSHITNLYNNQAERELKPHSVGSQLRALLKSGNIEQPRPGYYRLARN